MISRSMFTGFCCALFCCGYQYFPSMLIWWFSHILRSSFDYIWKFVNTDFLSASEVALNDTHEKTALHYSDIMMGAIASQITSPTIFYSTDYSDAEQRKRQTPRHWPLCGEFLPGTGEFPHKWPVTRKMFPFDDVIMIKHNNAQTCAKLLECSIKFQVPSDRSCHRDLFKLSGQLPELL